MRKKRHKKRQKMKWRSKKANHGTKPCAGRR
jgi:hypothetical protein